MGILLFAAIVVALLILLYFVSEFRNKNFFESQGVPYTEKHVLRSLLNLRKGLNLLDSLSFKYGQMKAKGQLLTGTFELGKVSLTIRDVGLLKAILIKDFDHFSDRRQLAIPENDIVFRKMLVSQSGESWKTLRSKLSPTFTTGKIKRLFHIFNESGKKLVKFMESEMANSADKEVDLTLGYSKFTMDIIASAACGINSHTFDQKESSKFEKMGIKLQFNLNFVTIVKFLITALSTRLADFLGISFFSKECQDFFAVAIKSSIKHRQEKGEPRDDFVQLMLEAREGKLITDENELNSIEKDAQIELKGQTVKMSTAEMLNDDGIVANCVLFFLAGFDTTQSALLFCAYALAINQDVQDMLRAEVDKTLEENDGDFTYESLSKMTYLDMVINETLRYYPPNGMTDRCCTRDYKVPGTSFTLKKGSTIVVPIHCLHHDEEFYSEPDKFLPERFSLENKSKLNPYAFLPFGQGPRNCIGMRFALTEVRVAIAHLVHNFRIEPSTKTLIPMKYSKSASLKPEGGMFLALDKIHH